MFGDGRFSAAMATEKRIFSSVVSSVLPFDFFCWVPLICRYEFGWDGGKQWGGGQLLQLLASLRRFCSFKIHSKASIDPWSRRKINLQGRMGNFWGVDGSRSSPCAVRASFCANFLRKRSAVGSGSSKKVKKCNQTLSTANISKFPWFSSASMHKKAKNPPGWLLHPVWTNSFKIYIWSHP